MFAVTDINVTFVLVQISSPFSRFVDAESFSSEYFTHQSSVHTANCVAPVSQRWPTHRISISSFFDNFSAPIPAHSRHAEQLRTEEMDNAVAGRLTHRNVKDVGLCPREPVDKGCALRFVRQASCRKMVVVRLYEHEQDSDIPGCSARLP